MSFIGGGAAAAALSEKMSSALGYFIRNNRALFLCSADRILLLLYYFSFILNLFRKGRTIYETDLTIFKTSLEALCAHSSASDS